MEYPPVCSRCKNKALCAEGFLCPAIDLLSDGDKPLKEALININPDYPNQDYKQVLISLQQNRCMTVAYLMDNIHIEHIRTITDVKRRAAVAMIYAGLKQDEAAKILNITRRHLRRIVMSEVDDDDNPNKLD